MAKELAGDVKAGTSDAEADFRALAGLLRRDPQHLPERLVTYACARLGEPARDWAARRRDEPGYDRAAAIRGMRQSTARLSRLDGAIAGTPFLIALVPAYVQVLWAQMWLVLRIAALHGRDPADPAMAAEILALRGVHKTPESAQLAIDELPADPPPKAWRAPLRTWVILVYRVLILAGFLQAPETGPRRGRLIAALGLLVAGAIWVLTWVLPVAFMVVMSWACESDTRKTGARAEVWYAERSDERSAADRPGSIAVRRDPGSRLRRAVRVVLLFLLTATPIAFLAIGVSRGDTGGTGLRVGAAVVGIAVVVALGVGLRMEQRR